MTEHVAEGGPRQVPYAFQYQVPDEFVRLPEPTTSEGWQEAMAKLMPEADGEQLTETSEQIRSQLPRLSTDDTTVLTAMCVGTEEVDGDERLSMGLLAVTVKPSGHRDRLLAAEGVYRAKEKSLFGGQGELQELDFPLGKGVQGRQDMLLAAKLPCGPGVMSTSLRTLTLPAATGLPVTAEVPATADVAGAAGTPEDGAGPNGSTGAPPAPASTSTSTSTSASASASTRPSIAIAALQLIIPAPRDYCVYVTISTPSVFLIDSYSGRLAHIGRTFSFDVPDAKARPSAGTGP